MKEPRASKHQEEGHTQFGHTQSGRTKGEYVPTQVRTTSTKEGIHTMTSMREFIVVRTMKGNRTEVDHSTEGKGSRQQIP